MVCPTNKSTILRLKSGETLQSHRGVLAHDDLIGRLWGSQVHNHTGSYYFLLQPSLHDSLKETRRNTQIMYPKDIGYILVKLGIGPGTQVVEAGTGSGALTTALAWSVGPAGRVISYDMRPEMQALARKNLERVALLERVTLKERDIVAGFDESGVEALFLDLPNPYDYLEQAYRLLRPKESYFDSMTHFDFKTLLPALFHVEDRVSMALGLESRVPLLDHPLVELAATIPSNIKFESGELKHLMKTSFRQDLPEDVRQRKNKMGFPVPLSNWMQGELKEFVEDIFHSDSARHREYLSRDFDIRTMMAQEGKFTRKVWGLLSLELWQQEFHDKADMFRKYLKGGIS